MGPNEWLPLHFNNWNSHTSFVLDLEAHRKRRKRKVKPRPRIVTLLRRARYFQHLLDSGHVTTRTQIAHREGLTRARVTQIMNLLKLAPDIQEAILALPRGTPERLVTEHQLRPLIPLDHEAQRARFQEKWGLLTTPETEKQVG